LKNPAFGPATAVRGPIFKNGCKAGPFPGTGTGARHGTPQPRPPGRTCGGPPGPYFFLCLFFRSFFLRLWVAILRSLRFLPQGTSASPCKKYVHFPGPLRGRQESLSSLGQRRGKVKRPRQGRRINQRDIRRRRENTGGQNAWGSHACFAPVNPCNFLRFKGRKASVK
jgi:hypothetical protein